MGITWLVECFLKNIMFTLAIKCRIKPLLAHSKVVVGPFPDMRTNTKTTRNGIGRGFWQLVLKCLWNKIVHCCFFPIRHPYLGLLTLFGRRVIKRTLNFKMSVRLKLRAILIEVLQKYENFFFLGRKGLRILYLLSSGLVGDKVLFGGIDNYYIYSR